MASVWAWRKLDRTKMMVDVAREALELRRESERISGNQLRAGATSAAKNAEAIAATRNAEADEVQARLAYLGRAPGQIGQNRPNSAA